ncbi:MAG: phenylacetate--CoA ligase family protein [Rhodospirillales bacterium]|nr:MAG: phenylacetate--CoA ligase family protein [Rhodospirillales bacterium]
MTANRPTTGAAALAKRVADLASALVIAGRLSAHDRWTPEQLARHQREAVLTRVRHAARHSPFYAELYAGLDLGDDLDLGTLPITGKTSIMDNFDRVVTDRRLNLADAEEYLATLEGDSYHLGRYRMLATTGTSGRRGVFIYDRPAWSVVLANTLRWQRTLGIRPRLPRRVAIASIGADDPTHVSCRIPASGDVGLFRTKHLSATMPIDRLAAELQAFRPDVVLAYPSVAALLAAKQREGRLAIHPRLISTHSETLTRDMARQIEEIWGLTPFDHYGLSEEPHLAWECPHHNGMHVFSDLAYIEVVDDQHRPLPPGEVGRFLLTNLYNATQPLIRYEITDMLALSAEPCTCGRPFPVIQHMAGRMEDVLYLQSPGGRPVAILPAVFAFALESFAEVREYRVEHSPDAIRLSVVMQAGSDEAGLRRALARKVRQVVENQGAPCPPISVTLTDRFDRAAGAMGKHKLIESVAAG